MDNLLVAVVDLWVGATVVVLVAVRAVVDRAVLEDSCLFVVFLASLVAVEAAVLAVAPG